MLFKVTYALVVSFLMAAIAGANVQHYKVRIHETVKFENSTLEFSKVITDSRCPDGEDCYWPGVFIAEFKFTKDGKDKLILLGNRNGKSVEVNSVFDPNFTDYKDGQKKVAGFEFDLNSVAPPAHKGKKLEARDYLLTISIKKARGTN